MSEYSPREFRGLWPEFAAESWQGWASVEDAIFGMVPADPEIARKVTAREELPAEQVAEAWIVAGRGAGKSRWAARLAVYFAAGRTYARRAPGENIFCGIFGPTRQQAGITARYVSGLMHAEPALERMIVAEQLARDSVRVELENGCVVEVLTASKAAPRGRTYSLAIIEEAAFLPADDSAEPDVELVRAIRPGLARVPGSLLVVVSSPYARRGSLYDAHRRHYGKPSPHALVVQAATEVLNPSFDPREIARAYDEDPVAAAAEYGARFRADVESYVSREVVESCIFDHTELAPVPGVSYEAFVDPSGGSRDSFALAIGHRGERDGQPVAIVDCLRERRAPFSPEAVVAEFAEVLRRYGIRRIEGDRYAGQWPAEAFQRHGIRYEPAAKPKSDLYRDALAVLNACRVELPRNDRLLAQLVSLERRTSRGGRDSVDHSPGGSDDLANVVAGLAVRLAVTDARADERRRVRRLWLQSWTGTPGRVPGRPAVTPLQLEEYLENVPAHRALPAEEQQRRTRQWMIERQRTRGG